MKVASGLLDEPSPLVVVRGEMDEKLVQELSRFAEVHMNNHPSNFQPKLFVVQLKIDSDPIIVTNFLLRSQAAPILVILESACRAKYYRDLNFSFKNATGRNYLDDTSVPHLLREAVQSVSQNYYFCDPAVNWIRKQKNDKRRSYYSKL